MRNKAFTLTEVMFAVITLGIGLIMVAAVFPVAIQQRKLTGEETSAAALAPQALAMVAQVATEASMPGTSLMDTSVVPNVAFPGMCKSFRNPQGAANAATPVTADGLANNDAYNVVRGNFVLPSDPRIAWIPLYRRDGQWPVNRASPTDDERATWSPTAQILLIAVQARNTNSFGPLDYGAAGGTPALVNLQPRPINVRINNNDPDADTIEIVPITTGGWTSDGAAVEGAHVIISDDGLFTPVVANTGRLNGRVYRLGQQRFDLATTLAGATSVWELMPGSDFKTEPDPDGAGAKTTITSLPNAKAFIIGRGFRDPSVVPSNPVTAANPTGDYDGAAMDVSVYTGFVTVKP